MKARITYSLDSDIFDSRDLLDELKTLDKEDDEERIEAIEELIEEVGEDNFDMGVAFIRENYWESIAKIRLMILVTLTVEMIIIQYTIT